MDKTRKHDIEELRKVRDDRTLPARVRQNADKNLKRILRQQDNPAIARARHVMIHERSQGNHRAADHAMEWLERHG